MNGYLQIVPKYLAAHKKGSRLAVISVAISVALVTGIFSMLEAFVQFEKIQVIRDYGNFHLAVENPREEEMHVLGSRLDVKNAGLWMDLGKAEINGRNCSLGFLSPNFAPNMSLELTQGRYPTEKNELLLEEWVMKDLGLAVNDKVRLSLGGEPAREGETATENETAGENETATENETAGENETATEYVISGVYRDLSSTKAAGIPGVLLSVKEAQELRAALELKGTGTKNYYLLQLKDGVKAAKAEAEIKQALGIPEERIHRNEHLLTVIGQGSHETAIGIYQTGAILFCLVLLAGVMMIYNTFNISVLERTRQFGLLRCIGASRSQIKNLVKREGWLITARAIPLGVLAGILLTLLCSAILKYFNASLFGEMPLLNFSLTGIAAGAAVGILTVLLACHLPARKAARVSPIQALAENTDLKIPKQKKQGYLTTILPVETAMGLNNAFLRKKTLLLMSCSVAVSIVIFLGFQVFVDFMHYSLKTTKPYTPDLSLTSEQGLNSLYEELAGLEGVDKVYGRMFDYVEASFQADKLTEQYKEIVGEIQESPDGLFIPPEKSWLISYDQNQLKWAKTDLIAGDLSEEKLNAQKGIIAVAQPLRKGVGIETTTLGVGDKVYIQTPEGRKEMTVTALLSKVPFSDSATSLTTFITTEKLFQELTGDSTLQVIDIQLKRSRQEQTIAQIKGLLDETVSFHDHRQKNAEVNQTFLTMAVFIYGFVIVIAMIGALNLMNTMFTGVIAKTRYLGVMRAIGMSGDQLQKMVLVEALTYCLFGFLGGCILGIALQKALIANFLPRLTLSWEFPWLQIPLILLVILIVTNISIRSPLKRIKAKGISELIGALY